MDDERRRGQNAEGFRNVEEGLRQYFQKRHARTKLIVNTSWYLGKVMHVENRLGAAVRDAVLKYLVDSGRMMKMAEKELLQHCPVPMRPLPH